MESHELFCSGWNLTFRWGAFPHKLFANLQVEVESQRGLVKRTETIYYTDKRRNRKPEYSISVE
jgi:hypothetical protein